MNTNITNSDTKEAPIKKMFFYSFGNIVSTFFITAYSTLIFYYYEVEVGLPVLLVSLALILFAIFNMISVPLLGWLTDRPTIWTKKYGFRTPDHYVGISSIIILYIPLYTSEC